MSEIENKGKIMQTANVFQFTIEHATEMILVFEAGGKILYANPAAETMLKYKESMKEANIRDIFPMEEGWIHHPKDKTTQEQEFMAYRRNRTCFPVKAKFLPFAAGYEKKQEVYLCIARDVTGEKFLEKKVEQIEEEAKEAAKIKSEFVASVTHELRTPVNGILGNVRELIGLEKGADNQKYLQMIERSCRDMNHLINNILDFSKLEAGKFTLENRKFNFFHMMEYIRGNHSKRMMEKGLDFTMTVSRDVPEFVIGDELRIVQILNNLISNGYKFTSVGGVHLEVIKTACYEKRVELFFMVSDTGIGISKENQDKLFQSFSQVDMSISRKYGGTGLGLNICKQLVELMGGTIQMESEYGQGTQFSFHIWVELPEEEDSAEFLKEEIKGNEVPTEQALFERLKKITTDTSKGNVWKYGEDENREELQKKMSKLMLCILMENWEKAEMLAETIKQLVEEAPKEIKNAAFRMKMAVQKEDVEKATENHDRLLKMMEDRNGSVE